MKESFHGWSHRRSNDSRRHDEPDHEHRALSRGLEVPGWTISFRAHSAQRMRSDLRSARSGQHSRHRSGTPGRNIGSDLRAHLGGRQEPADRRHQRSQCGRRSRSGSDEARLSLHHREGTARRHRKALRARHHRRRRQRDLCRRAQGKVELQAHRRSHEDLLAEGLVHFDRARRRDEAQRRVGGLPRITTKIADPRATRAGVDSVP